MSEDEQHPAADWPTLRKELLAEGKADLVAALDTLIEDGRRVEAIRLLNQIVPHLADNDP